jgi:AcrR family transcriptional regulator
LRRVADDGRTGLKAAAARPADVRAALLDAALRLIETLPEDKVSLRACARLAGVSHAAPAHYFPTRAALIAAVLASGYERLTLSMETRMAAAGEDPADRLQACGLGYIDFAFAHPRLYRMMFQPSYFTEPGTELAESGLRCRQVLDDAVAATHRRPEVTQSLGATFAWANVHGFVELVNNGLITLDDEPRIIARRLLALIDGAFRA